MNDYISRQAAIDVLWKERQRLNAFMNECLEKGQSELRAGTKTERNRIEEDIEIIKDLPSAEEESFEWCTNCKEYDQEAHCCHRWTKVIRNTVEEIRNEQRWIPVSERLPEDLVGVLVDDDGTTAIGYCEHYWDDDGKTCVEWHDLLHYRIEPHYWMPLPEPYKDGDVK